MSPKWERRGRRRGKRSRDEISPSSREDGAVPANEGSQSTSTPPWQTINRPPPPSTSGSGPVIGNLLATSDVRSSQPVNVITSRAPPGKVAIPALRPQNIDSSNKGNKKGRTSHACDYCRKAKAACTGEQPCTRCRTARVPCVYGDGKRELDRKKMTKLSKESISLSQHNAIVTRALRSIQLNTTLSPQELRAAIDDVLAIIPAPAMPDDTSGSIEASLRPSSERDEGDEIDDGSESGPDAKMGSTGSVDIVNVDTDLDDTRATGHMGKASAVAWTRRTTEECRESDEQDPVFAKSDRAFTFSSYHVEDADVEFVDTSSVHPYDWPEYNYADTLVKSYFEHTHDAFPILDRASFMARYRTFERGSADLDLYDVIWLGTLNAVFAISAVFLHYTKSDYRGPHNDHLFYCARAKILLLDQEFLFQDARVSTTCFLGLMSLYHISNCKLNRAWTICGLAIRHALTLGLHVRSEAEALSDVSKEHRVRVWWALYSLEVFLDELTGRPSCISDRDISTPLPININEEEFQEGQPLYETKDSLPTESSSRRSSKGRPFATYQMPVGYSHPLAYSFPVVELPVTSSTYFIYRTQLTIISHEIVTQLYCAATIKEKWSEVQDTIGRIDHRLLAWQGTLPDEFNITFDTWTEPDWSDPHTLFRIGLAMLFNSARMILFRPCLCRFEGRIDKRSQKSKDFEQEAVEQCIQSARKMINLLRWSAKTAEKLYAITPWWTTLHYLCEALSVLMLEMAFEAQHLPKETAYILEDAKMCINWLAMMSDQSVAARKAWEIFDSLIRRVAPRIKWSIFDLPTEAPIPPGYNWLRFKSGHTGQGQQLSQANLQKYQTSLEQNIISQPQPNNPQFAVAVTNPEFAATDAPWVVPFNQGSLPNVTTASFQASDAPAPYAGNPLDNDAAIEHFSNLGHLHGHYDDPWQRLFSLGASQPHMGMEGTRADVDMMDAELRGYLGTDVGGFESLSRGNDEFAQRGRFETQGERSTGGQQRTIWRPST